MTAVRGEQIRLQLPVTGIVELTECCEGLKDRSVLLLLRRVAGISGKRDNMDELNKQLRLVFKQPKGVSKAIHLVDKVDKSPCAARHESAHHPFVLMSRRQVALDE